HPIEELPYFRVVMARKQHEARHVQFAEEHAEAVETVRQAIASQGPQSAADFAEAPTRKSSNTFRSGKVANQALYYLWLTGETLTSHRQGLERIFDLRERLVPARFNVAATADEADAFFALKVWQRGGLLSAQQWRSWFAGTIARSVGSAEAAARLEALLSEGKIARVFVEEEPEAPYLLLSEDLPLLEQLHAGRLPQDWQPLETTTDEEMTFLAPLEIVSTRGRALPLFDFDYLWEVYKPAEQRRWGYYTLPILYKERLVARTDLKLERTTNTLVVKGFWLEHHAVITDEFVIALARAFERFMRFTEAKELDCAVLGLED
ncbi:MAG: DNA glycosylase AlkZ-like family protein, partial [Ktedonobacterales bacterium]